MVSLVVFYWMWRCGPARLNRYADLVHMYSTRVDRRCDGCANEVSCSTSTKLRNSVWVRKGVRKCACNCVDKCSLDPPEAPRLHDSEGVCVFVVPVWKNTIV
jgi:hypothetical protein